jgi:hypothetical protein
MYDNVRAEWIFCMLFNDAFIIEIMQKAEFGTDYARRNKACYVVIPCIFFQFIISTNVITASPPLQIQAITRRDQMKITSSPDHNDNHLIKLLL